MPLEAGSSIGPYDIVGLIGTGGMGEVYRARDRKLHRDVALKILPEPFATDAERLTRFEREARTLAALNHPHIAQIYGVEESNGARALVMELVDGQTLADRLARGALPVPETVAFARQIADALDAAHERGIIHRDLKPANIMLRPDDTAKVLDFGLAKAFDSRIDAPPAESPTMTAAGTRAGVILGTAAYMSPEQARGLPVDKRTDIWAFGCVVYEMLTGGAAFAGDTVSDTVARILEREPDWSRLPHDTPPAIRRLLGRCLEKDVRRRVRDIGDARMELEQAYGSTPEQAAEPSPQRPRAVIWWVVAVGAVTLVPGFLAGLMWRDTRRTPPEPPRDVVRFTISLPPGELFAVDQTSPPSLAISPGGERIAYVVRGRDGDRLNLRQRGDPVPVPLAGTEGALGPFFSPDGQWIGFASGGMLRKMAVNGGAPSALAPAPNFAGATWAVDGTIIYSPDWRNALVTVSAEGGTPRPLTSLDVERNEIEHVAPHILPGGRHVLLAVGTGAPETRALSNQQIALLDLATSQRRMLTEGSNPHYLASGHLVFARGEALFAAPFDLGRLELTGPPVRVLDGIRNDGNDTQFAVASVGTLAFISSETARNDRRLVRVDRKGRMRPFTDDRAPFVHPRISPDGQHVVVQAAGEFLVYSERGTRSRIRAKGARPIWMPDGRSILFNAQGRLYAAPVDDTSEPRLVLAPEQGFAFPLAWSKDGRVLLYSNPVPGANRSRDVWVLPSGGEPRPLLTTARDERSAMFSPDGRWIVYAEKDVGREEEVYVQPYPGPGPREIVSRGGGIEPVWSPTGSEIFYRSIDGRRLMTVAVRTEPTFSAGTPQVLFEGPYPLSSTYWSDYDVWPGGEEFLLIAAGAVSSPELHVVLNWTADVLQRMPRSE